MLPARRAAAARRAGLLPRAALCCAALALSAEAQTEACSDGFVRSAPAVFSCQGSGGQRSSRYLAAAGTTEVAFSIPKGTDSFTLSMVPEDHEAPGAAPMGGPSEQAASGRLDLILYNPSTQQFLVRYDTGLVNEQTPTAKLPDGMTITYSGSGQSSQRFTFGGTTTELLQVQVQNRGVYPAPVVFNYSFTSVEGCEEPWVEGCKYFSPFKAQRTVVDWSGWAAAKYKTASQAWEALAGPMKEYSSEHPDGVVPYYKWSYVWNSWPLAMDKGAGWPDVYFYLTGGREFATRADFDRGFQYSEVSTATQACMADFHRYHKSADEAWDSLSKTADGIEVLMNNCSKESGIPYETLKSFVTEADRKEGFGKEEFQVLWDQLNACPADYYRASPIVFHCHPSSGRVKFFMRARMTEIVTMIPQGVVNLEIGVVSDQDIDVLLYDEAATKWVVKWEGGVVNRHQLEGSYKGAKIRFSGDQTRPPLVEEFVRIQGALPVALSLQVNNFAAEDATAVVTYSWDDIQEQDCPAVPQGCAPFNKEVSKKAINDFSSWMEESYSSAELAWQRMCSRYAEHFAGNDRLALELEGVPFYQWQAVWEMWSEHRGSEANWQESFHFADADQNGMVDEQEFRRMYRGPKVSAMLNRLFKGLDDTFPDWGKAWDALAGEPNAPFVEASRWGEVVREFMGSDTLPGGARVCAPYPKFPPHIFGHAQPLDMGTAYEPQPVGLAEELGLVGGSFTAVARVWTARGASEEQSCQVLSAHGRKDQEDGRQLTIGAPGGELLMSFGGASCKAQVPMPSNQWATAAWVFDAVSGEQRLHVNGAQVRVCKGVSRFQGFGQEVVIGSCPAEALKLAGKVNGLYLFPSALKDEEIADVFKYTPSWSHASDIEMDSGDGAVEMGEAQDLGLDDGSFTAMAMVLRSPGQDNSDESVYTIMGTPEDNSFDIVVYKGALGISFDGKRCASDLLVPVGQFVRAAFVYNARTREQNIYQDGTLVKTCKDVSPYKGGKKKIWAGKSATAANNWLGTIKGAKLLARVECLDNIEALFDMAPRRRLSSADASESLSQAIAEESFERVDGDGDGVIASTEFLSGMSDFTGKDIPDLPGMPKPTTAPPTTEATTAAPSATPAVAPPTTTAAPAVATPAAVLPAVPAAPTVPAVPAVPAVTPAATPAPAPAVVPSTSETKSTEAPTTTPSTSLTTTTKATTTTPEKTTTTEEQTSQTTSTPMAPAPSPAWDHVAVETYAPTSPTTTLTTTVQTTLPIVWRVMLEANAPVKMDLQRKNALLAQGAPVAGGSSARGAAGTHGLVAAAAGLCVLMVALASLRGSAQRRAPEAVLVREEREDTSLPPSPLQTTPLLP